MGLFAVVLLFGLALLGIVLAIIVFGSRDGRRGLTKLYYHTKSFFLLDVGKGGLVRIVLFACFPAVPAAFAKGYDGVTHRFDWHMFGMVAVVAVIAGIVFNFLQISMSAKKWLSPGAGQVYRESRKNQTTAIIDAINVKLGQQPVSIGDAKRLLRDILDLIVSHVRDHRGHYSEDHHVVFANITLDAGSDIVVVARDSRCHELQYGRSTPAVYSKGAMFISRVIASRSVQSLDDLLEAYPEGPRNKPYRSILGIPLISSSGVCYGCITVDCSVPYFFSSFRRGEAENSLENSVLPYVKLAILVLERLISNDLQTLIAKLNQP